MSISKPIEGARYFPHEGAKVGIILLHAYTGSPLDVNLLARKLYRSGYAVLCPKFSGHASQNINELLMVAPESWARNTQEAIEFMQNSDVQKIYIFGLSLGGIFATWALTQRGFNLQGGGVFNSPVVLPEGINIVSSFMSYAESLWRKSNAIDFSEVKDHILHKHLVQMDKVNKFSQSFLELLPKIEQPFFIGQACQDELIPTCVAELLAERLNQAKVTLKWYPDNTHVITVNKNREGFENDLIHFIESASLT